MKAAALTYGQVSKTNTSAPSLITYSAYKKNYKRITPIFFLIIRNFRDMEVSKSFKSNSILLKTIKSIRIRSAVRMTLIDTII